MKKVIYIDEELTKESMKKSRKHKPTKEETEFNKDWLKRTKHVCKPCWELKYCPYGPLVEQFPLPPIERKEAVSHIEFLKEQLKKGAYNGWRKRFLTKEVKEFNPNNHPIKVPKEISEKSCNIFGHICPVFYVNEPFTETYEKRRISRTISRETMLRVVRRDNYICQKCKEPVREDELEFDHSIPYSKGGSSDENNIRLIHRECNRSKSAKTPDHVAPKEYHFQSGFSL